MTLDRFHPAVAIEVKGGARVRREDLKAMRAYVGEHRPRHAIVVCNEDAPRHAGDGIRVLPWPRFLEQLWADEIVE